MSDPRCFGASAVESVTQLTQLHAHRMQGVQMRDDLTVSMSAGMSLVGWKEASRREESEHRFLIGDSVCFVSFVF